jgi:ribosomal-protein-alanine N-acetyltransferase
VAGAPEARLRVRLRAATVSDVKAIAQIERQSFSDPWSEGSFASLVGSADVFFQVAESPEAHAVAGYVVAWFAAGHGDVANIAVAPWARRRGVGATLLDAALSFARTARTHEVYLEVRESNATARALYASRGFAEVGRRRGYYRRPVEDALVLRLDMAVGRPQ